MTERQKKLKMLESMIRKVVREERKKLNEFVDKKEYQSKSVKQVAGEFEKKFISLMEDYILALEYARGRAANNVRPEYIKKAKMLAFNVFSDIAKV